MSVRGIARAAGLPTRTQGGGAKRGISQRSHLGGGQGAESGLPLGWQQVEQGLVVTRDARVVVDELDDPFGSLLGDPGDHQAAGAVAEEDRPFTSS